MLKKGVIGFLVGIVLLVIVLIIGLYPMIKKMDEMMLNIEQEKIDMDIINSIPFNSTINLISFPNKNKDTLFFSENKVVFINFWATWCKPCIAEMTEIEKLYGNKKENIDFYIISAEDYNTVDNFLQKEEWNLPFYTLTDSVDFLKYKSLPRTYIIKNNIIYFSHIGKNNWNRNYSAKI